MDAVIQTLGILPNPVLIFSGTRLFSEATRILVDATEAKAVKRLICVTGLGAGGSRGHGGLLYNAALWLILGLQAALRRSPTVRTGKLRSRARRNVHAIGSAGIVNRKFPQKANDYADYWRGIRR